MRREAIYLTARAELLKMLGAERPHPKLRLVSDKEPSPYGADRVRKARWSPLQDRKRAANS